MRSGLALAALGLACFATNTLTGGAATSITLACLAPNLGAAAMWAASNIVARKAQQAQPGFDALQFVVWVSLVPILPFAAMA